MKFTVSQPALNRGLAIASKAMASNAQEPILAGVMVTAKDGTVELQTTDRNVSVRHSIPANVEEQGCTVVSGKLLTNAVKSFPDDPVNIESDGPTVTVTCRKSKLVLHTLDPVDFPEFVVGDTLQEVTLPYSALSNMADGVCKATSKDQSRPMLGTVKLTVNDGMAEMVATDSYRLSLCRHKADGEFEANIPSQTLKDVSSMASGDVTISQTEGQIVMSFGNTTFLTRKVDGNFPDWRRLMPQGHKSEVTVDSDELSAALKRVSVVATNNPSVRVSTERTLLADLTLYASSPDNGESTETIPADLDGEDVLIGLNYHYLLDATSAMSGEMRMRFNGSEQPAVMEMAGDDMTFIAIVMPTRL